MYGAQFPRTNIPVKPLGYAVGTNSTQFTKGDILEKNSGFLKVVNGGTDILIGISDYSGTMASDNQTVAKQEVPYIPADRDFLFEMDFDNDAAAADQGSYFTITGATGAQQVSYASKSATVGQVVLEKLDPRGEGSVRRGLFRFAKTSETYTPAT